MKKLVYHPEKADEFKIRELIQLCPFGAIENTNGTVQITAACKMCMICVKKGPAGVMEFCEESVTLDKSLWKGIGVYVDHMDGNIHPVTMELIGKACELAKTVHFPVYCLFIGRNIRHRAEELLHYGVDEVFVYDEEELQYFRIEPYTAVVEDFINKVKPSSFLVGATLTGRSLAPRAAARFRTGLTADCTKLLMMENSDLVQIRPAFGGNIMAQIRCPSTRPQMATVRYKVMNAPVRNCDMSGKITCCSIEKSKLQSGIRVLEVTQKETETNISDAEVIIAIGRAVKSQKDLLMIEELASLLDARIAGTRPMAEAGMIPAKRQIGLSGRTVKPKLILTFGISGSVQFTAGMDGSEQIFAVNTDPHAPIFKIAHYGIVGDLYEVIPQMIHDIRIKG